MIKRKTPFTLIEVLIALSLVGVLLYTLFSSLVTTTKIAKELSTVKPAVLEKSFAYQRLTSIISQAPIENISLKKKGSEEEYSILDLTFLNPIDPEFIYSGEVKGEISLIDKTITLSIWPKEEGHPLRREPLLQGVDKIVFEKEYASHILLHVTRGETQETFALFPERPHCLGWDGAKAKGVS